MKLKFLIAALLFAAPAQAQNFTSAAEVRPILDATKSSWIAIREYDGKDLLYFTHLLAWRCGLASIHFSINNGAEEVLNGEPCYDGEAQPNAIKAADFLPFIRFGLNSIESVQVRLVYDDGGQGDASFQRNMVLMP